MNKLHKQINQPKIETFSYCGDNDTYTIAIITQTLAGGTILLEAWYNRDMEGIAHHACGVVGDTEENKNIIINEAINLIEIEDKEDYEN